MACRPITEPGGPRVVVYANHACLDKFGKARTADQVKTWFAEAPEQQRIMSLAVLKSLHASIQAGLLRLSYLSSVVLAKQSHKLLRADIAPAASRTAGEARDAFNHHEHVHIPLSELLGPARRLLRTHARGGKAECRLQDYLCSAFRSAVWC